MNIPVTIADDSTLSRKCLRKALPASFDACITEVTNGAEALQAVREGKADVLFLDLQMPVMDGYAVLAELHQHHAKTVVIVLSADIQPKAIERVYELGAYRFLKKPLDPVLLQRVLTEVGLI